MKIQNIFQQRQNHNAFIQTCRCWSLWQKYKCGPQIQKMLIVTTCGNWFISSHKSNEEMKKSTICQIGKDIWIWKEKSWCDFWLDSVWPKWWFTMKLITPYKKAFLLISTKMYSDFRYLENVNTNLKCIEVLLLLKREQNIKKCFQFLLWRHILTR